MTVADILKSVKYVVNTNGKQSAVVVDMEVWEQIVTLLENAEDAEEIEQLRTTKEDTVSLNTVK